MENIEIAVIGLGYVGLPLAIAFAKENQVIGFDINQNRIDELNNDKDHTLEIESELLIQRKSNIKYTSSLNDISKANFYIVTVPTPIDEYKRPDLTPIIESSKSISKILKKGDIVVYESTVYPGATEEVCVPILESGSKLKFNKDFFCGYSPERINPGDKRHTVEKILKVTSGSTPTIAQKVDSLYKKVITAGTYKASSIKVAEAAKVIENSQRDINIAFVNELSKIFNLLGIDTNEVLEAASTKWNFLPFKPGLVGGHCIGVDPYYLAEKAKEVGYNPEIILSGRRINDGMAEYIANQIIKGILKKGITLNQKTNTLILGITFKENCPDIRNSQVFKLIQELQSFNLNIDVYDPWANKEEVKKEYNLELLNSEPTYANYDSIIIAVAHDQFKTINFERLQNDKRYIFDIKSIVEKTFIDNRL